MDFFVVVKNNIKGLFLLENLNIYNFVGFNERILKILKKN